MNPWAILFEEDEIIWSFGVNEADFPAHAKNLVLALQEFGQNLWGQGVTTVEFSYGLQKQEPSDFFTGPIPDQLFVVNLSDYFLLLISDVTAVVSIMPFINLHPDMDDLLRSVLIGQGVNIFANLMLRAEVKKEELEIERLFRKILRLSGRKDSKQLVIKGNFTLSPLTIPELLLFHAFLRDHFHTLSVAKNLEHWALMAHNTGSEIKLIYNISADKSVLLSGLLSAFIKYTQFAFGIIPTRMVFGSIDLQDIRIFASPNYFIAMNNAEKVLIDAKFKKSFSFLHIEDRNEVTPFIVPFLQFESSRLIQKRLMTDYPALIVLYERLRHESDVLTNIRGIGPKIEKLLFQAGIKNISVFVKLDLKKLQAIIDENPNERKLTLKKLLNWQNQGRRILKSSQRINV
ncbi:MAG: hypothetical protein ACXAC7_08875 [Candidatus Hodarchaeales archaeon]|jgi:hypothetical protein